MRKRAKPLLGTLVEIRADCDSESSFIAATDSAFARVEAIHRAMSFHEVTSDLQAVARARVGECVQVTVDTWNVLTLALRIEHHSHGLFNPTIAPTLVKRGWLPCPEGAQTAPTVPAETTLSRSIRLDAPCSVHVLQPVWIDLGGIAKGYAVDAAVSALIAQGARAGVVNAGGDLRVFGNTEQLIELRDPAHARVRWPVATLRDLSCATSGDYFLNDYSAHDRDAQSAIVGRRIAQPAAQVSVTVIAPLCAVADALTKVLWLAGVESAISRALLKQYEAQAVVLDIQGAATYG
jgi:FAD:protein FMN transferase